MEQGTSWQQQKTRKESYGHVMKGLQCEAEETIQHGATEDFWKDKLRWWNSSLGNLFRYLWD